MNIKNHSVALLFMAGCLFVSTTTEAQRVSDQYIKSAVVKGDADESSIYSVKDLVVESSKDRSSFEMLAVKRVDNGDKFLVVGKHHVAATNSINGTPGDLPLANMIGGKAENKFYEARFPQVSYSFVSIDEADAKNLLEKVKQLRQNYIDSDTVKVKNETLTMQYRLNDQFAVTMSRGKNGSSAKYFELIIGNRRQVVNSDKFIMYLVDFLAY